MESLTKAGGDLLVEPYRAHQPRITSSRLSALGSLEGQCFGVGITGRTMLRVRCRSMLFFRKLVRIYICYTIDGCVGWCRCTKKKLGPNRLALSNISQAEKLINNKTSLQSQQVPAKLITTKKQISGARACSSSSIATYAACGRAVPLLAVEFGHTPYIPYAPSASGCFTWV